MYNGFELYKEGFMALYSWFTRTSKSLNRQSVKTNTSLVNTPETPQYIANYTMWPTAKIKPRHEPIIATYKNKSANTKKTLLLTAPTLAVVKS